jgi:hypothetical protein
MVAHLHDARKQGPGRTSLSPNREVGRHYVGDDFAQLAHHEPVRRDVHGPLDKVAAAATGGLRPGGYSSSPSRSSAATPGRAQSERSLPPLARLRRTRTHGWRLPLRDHPGRIPPRGRRTGRGTRCADNGPSTEREGSPHRPGTRAMAECSLPHRPHLRHGTPSRRSRETRRTSFYSTATRTHSTASMNPGARS